MPPRRAATKSSARTRSTKATTHLDVQVASNKHDDSGPGEVFDNPSSDDSDSAAVEQAPKATGKKATKSAPSVPSELATTQGRTAFDIRYFFNIPDKTCYRCT